MIDDLSANPSSESDHRARRTRSISPITAVPMFPEAAFRRYHLIFTPGPPTLVRCRVKVDGVDVAGATLRTLPCASRCRI